MTQSTTTETRSTEQKTIPEHFDLVRAPKAIMDNDKINSKQNNVEEEEEENDSIFNSDIFSIDTAEVDLAQTLEFLAQNVRSFLNNRDSEESSGDN